MAWHSLRARFHRVRAMAPVSVAASYTCYSSSSSCEDCQQRRKLDRPAFVAEIAPDKVGLSSKGLWEAFSRFQTIATPAGQPLSGGVMVVSRHGKVCFVESFGARYEQCPEAMTSDSIFSIASMTKTVTSIAAMMLYEEGLLGLDDPVAMWLPALAKENLRVSETNGTTVACRNTMTVRHLMNHTAGFTYGMFFRRPEGDSMEQADPSSEEVVIETGEDYANCILAFQPGTCFRYSCGTRVLGFVVEAASGLALSEFFSKRIFGPLGMSKTSFVVAGADLHLLARPQVATAEHLDIATSEVVSNVMKEYDRGVAGPGQLSLRPGEPGVGLVRGDGGLHSTPEDWHRLANVLVQHGKGLMTEETFRIMVTPATPDLDDPTFNTHSTDEPGSSGRILSDMVLNAGGIAHNLVGESVVGPNVMMASRGAFGWEGIYSTKYIVDPMEGLVVTFWANVAPCWRYALMQECLPLIYDAIENPNVMPSERAVRPPDSAL